MLIILMFQILKKFFVVIIIDCKKMCIIQNLLENYLLGNKINKQQQ